MQFLNPFLKKGMHLFGHKQDFAPERLRSCLEASLRRLRTDRVEVFLLHSPSLAAIENGEALGVLADLKREGKVRHFGVSTGDVAALEFAVRAGAEVLEAPVNTKAPILPPCQADFIANQVFQSGRLLAEGAPRTHLAHALGQRGVSCVLTGTVSAAHLRQNVRDALEAASAPPVSVSRRGPSRSSAPPPAP